MEQWEFLIQREGERGWRPIKTGNLQLTEGRYRIVANTTLAESQIHTRVTHQVLGTKKPQRRSQARNQMVNAKGLVAIAPFIDLQSGIWQFVCSGNNPDGSVWHRILKLKVLQRVETRHLGAETTPPHRMITNRELSLDPVISEVMSKSRDRELSGEIPTPTAPLVPSSKVIESNDLVDALDRLLAQLEQDSLKPRQPLVRILTHPGLQLTPIAESPSRLLNLDQSTFVGIMPGHRLTITGKCNLQRFSANLVQAVTITKLLVCLRHPETSEIVVSIETTLPTNLATFAFSGQLELPLPIKTSLLLGEVNLYDRHNIQVGSDGFTVTLNLDPLPESALSFLQLLDDSDEEEDMLTSDLPQSLHYQQIDRELQLETSTIEPQFSSAIREQTAARSSIQTLGSNPYPHVPISYKRESLFAHNPDITPTDRWNSRATDPDTEHEQHLPAYYPNPTQPVTADITGDLDLGIPTLDRPHPPRYSDTLEVVVDD